MADQRITFNFAGTGSQLVSETKKVKAELDDLDAKTKRSGEARSQATQASTQATQANTQATKRASTGVEALAAKYYLVVQALQALLGAGRAVYGSLIAQNVQLQEQLLSTQSTLAATNKVVVDGVEIADPTAAILALEGPVNDALAKVRRDSLDLVGVTSAQLIPIFQNIAGESGKINANLSDAADLTIAFAAALGTTQVPLDQQRQEISSILRAQITSDSVLAKSLGINNEMVRSWQRQGTVVQELNSRLETFVAGNALAAQTIGGVASNIQEVFENITLEAGAGITATIAEDLSAFYDLLNANQDRLLAFVEDGVNFIESVFNTAKEGGADLLETLAPIGETLAEVFDEDLLNTVELLFQNFIVGLDEISKFVVDSGAIQALLKLVDTGVLATGAIASLNGEFAAGVEAADIYRRNAAAVSQQAVDTLGKIKRGEEGAAAARKESLAAIDDQLRILKAANVTGIENRRVVEAQVDELEKWRAKLNETGSGVELISKSTEQLTNDLKLLNEEFKDQTGELETAQSQLRAAVQRQLASGAIDTRAAGRQTLQIERETLDERIALAQDKLARIQALENAGGDDEQKKEFRRQRLATEKELAELEIQIADNTIKERSQREQDALRELERSQEASNARISASATAREIEIQRAVNDGVIRDRQAQERKLQAAQDRIQEELNLERRKASELEALSFADPDKQEANERKIRQSKQRTADLTLKLLQNQRQQEEALIRTTQKAIADQAAEERNQSEARQQQLSNQLKAQELMNQATDRQNELLRAQKDLAASLRTSLEIGGQVEVDNLSRALELRQKLNDENLDPEVRKVIEDQLKLLTGAPDTSEADILAQRILREQELAQIKRRTLAIEQESARSQQELELQRNKLAAERLVIETQIAQLAADSALNQAIARQRELEADPNADPQALRNAAADVARAQDSAGLADRTAENARQNLAQQDQLAEFARRKLTADQQAAVAQFEAAQFAKDQADQLALAEAKAQRIFEKLERTKNLDFGSTFNQLIERNQRLLNAAQPLLTRNTAPSANPGRTAIAPVGQGTSPGGEQLQQLVGLAQKQVNLADSLNSQILRVANRPGVTNQVTNNLVARDKILANTGL